jgi:hypothetical protein
MDIDKNMDKDMDIVIIWAARQLPVIILWSRRNCTAQRWPACSTPVGKYCGGGGQANPSV